MTTIRDATDETLDRIVHNARLRQLNQFATNLAAIAKDVREYEIPERPAFDMRKGRMAMAKQFAEIRAKHGL